VNLLKKINEIKDQIVEHPLLKRLEAWSKRRSLPGFFRVPIYDVVFFVFREFQRFDLFTRANSAAFGFFLSLFPSLIVLFTTIPLLKDYFLEYLPEGENFEEYLRAEISKIMPGVAGDRLFVFVEDVATNPRVGLLSFGTLLTIFFASNGMIALMRGFEKSYSQTFKNRGGLKKRFIAIFLTLFVGALLVGSIVLIILGKFLINWLADLVGLDIFLEFLLNALRWVVVIMLFYASIAMIYRYGAALRQRFKFFTPGATLASSLCILSSVVFSAYVNNFNTYNELYGAIGSIIVLMLWIQINSLFILVGFELNASIAVNRDKRREIMEEEEAP